MNKMPGIGNKALPSWAKTHLWASKTHTW